MARVNGAKQGVAVWLWAAVVIAVLVAVVGAVSASSRWTPACGPTTSGWSTPPRSSAPAPATPPTAPTWPDGPSRHRYGYCASHSRYFWGLRLHLIITVHGLPIAFALTGAKADERQTLLDILGADPDLVLARPNQTLIADKHYYGHDFEATLAGAHLQLLRPARKGEPPRQEQRFFKPLRQVIESVFDTVKGELDLERHGGHPRRRPGPRPATPARADRRHLAQRPH